MRLSLLRLVPSVSGVALLVLAAFGAQAQVPGIEEYPVASRIAAPDWTLQTIDGKTLSLADLKGKGKIVVLNFWATWNPSATKELPVLGYISRTYADKDVQFVGLSADLIKGNVDDIDPLIRKAGISYPIALITPEMKFRVLYQIRALPTTFFLDTQGRIAARSGEGTERQLRAELDALIAERAAVVDGAASQPAASAAAASSATP